MQSVLLLIVFTIIKIIVKILNYDIVLFLPIKFGHPIPFFKYLYPILYHFSISSLSHYIIYNYIYFSSLSPVSIFSVSIILFYFKHYDRGQPLIDRVVLHASLRNVRNETVNSNVNFFYILIRNYLHDDL